MSAETPLSYTPPIEHYRALLVQMTAPLFAWMGIEPGMVERHVPRRVKVFVLSRLRLLEAALRRVIFTLSRGLTVELPPLRASGKISTKARARATILDAFARPPLFRLVDPRKDFAVFRKGYGTAPATPAKKPALGDRDPVPAVAISRRLAALHHALENVELQALRMARLEARRKSAAHAARRKRLVLHPLRPGLPPGQIHTRYRRRERHQILAECHSMALRTLAPPGCAQPALALMRGEIVD